MIASFHVHQKFSTRDSVTMSGDIFGCQNKNRNKKQSSVTRIACVEATDAARDQRLCTNGSDSEMEHKSPGVCSAWAPPRGESCAIQWTLDLQSGERRVQSRGLGGMERGSETPTPLPEHCTRPSLAPSNDDSDSTFMVKKQGNTSWLENCKLLRITCSRSVCLPKFNAANV